jgi:signal transduction histidine kinase
MTGKPVLPYYGIAGLALLVALIAGWTPPAVQIDNYHYDWTLRLYAPERSETEAVILEFDDLSMQRYGGFGMRRALAQALDKMAAEKPQAVAIDLILADEGDKDDRLREDNLLLAEALRKTPNVVLATDLMPQSGQWEEPYPMFAPLARAIGHVHADVDRYDGVSRQIQLEKVGGRTRRWAMALEAYRLVQGGETIVETPKELRVGKKVIPVPKRGDEGRLLFIRYRRQAMPRVSVRELLEQEGAAKKLAGKVVFVGVTSQSQVRDRLVTPHSGGQLMPGVEIHAHIYETLARGDYLWPASNISVLLAAVMLSMATATIFAFVSGWQAYAAGGVQIVWAHALPHLLFGSGVVFPVVAPAGAAWLSVIGCAAFQYFVVEKQLRKTEADRSRYQQAIRFVTHEMKSPLTAIQGSSELMSRYNLSEEKRKNIAQMINSESKRLARMIQTWLDVERLSEGDAEIRREPFSITEMVIVCVERARPLAEKKQITFDVATLDEAQVLGDRELMEYAVYNLLSNAVKYSPAGTGVRVDARVAGHQVQISVRDQGIGMDEKELKQIGTRFFRTKKAQQSGEQGTGIGLSIVGQIVAHHGGRMEVASAPGEGSCFTIVIPVSAQQPA